jgi:hypothetical protein
MKLFSFATTTPSATAPRMTRTGLLFTRRVVRPGNALNVASFDRVLLASAFVERLETPFLCFVLMRWHKSHDRANSLTRVSSRLTKPRCTIR